MSGRPVKVSIIIPIYNVADYLETAISSCMMQTLYDIEIICVNDGSTDNSQEIVDRMKALDPRIISVVKENGGVSSARNAGLNTANGDIIMFLDADDYLSQFACERVWKEMREVGADIIGFGTTVFPTEPRADDWVYGVLTNVPNKRYWSFDPAALFVEKASKPFSWRNAFSKEFLDTYNIRYDERLDLGEDTVFQMEAYPHAKRIDFISNSLYHYRWFRNGSAMWELSEDLDRKMRKHIDMIEITTEYWEKNDWLSQYGDWYLEWILDFVQDLDEVPQETAEKHYARLHALVQKYGLETYWSGNQTKERIQRWKQLQNAVQK